MRIRNGDNRDEYLPILKYIAGQYSHAWISIAELYQEGDINNDMAKESIRSFIQNSKDEKDILQGWKILEKICVNTYDFDCQLQCLIKMCDIDDIEYALLSDSANKVNAIFKQKDISYAVEEKRVMIEILINKLEARKNEANADDYSRLAWLHMNLQNEDRAKEICRMGLEIDCNNEHCIKLHNRFLPI